MFKTIRLTLAVDRALFDIESRGLIDQSRRKVMLSMAGADVNRIFGVQMLKTGAAINKEAAAAGLFARLAAAAERTPQANNGISADDWRAATRQAFLNGGASDAESFMLVAALIEEVRL